MVGSIFWRINNYGFIATFNYIVNDFFNHKVINLENSRNILTSSTLSELKIEEADISFARNLVEKAILEMRDTHEYRDFKSKMKGVLNSDSSTARLIVLTVLLKKYQPIIYIETGTQHGISAYVVGKVCEILNLKTRCFSFDVCQNPYVIKHKNINYEIYNYKARRRFKNFTRQFTGESILFFHDSDHTTENMTFEFEWAWQNLNASILVSDDIDNNFAFTNFCQKIGIVGQRFLLDEGPAVGVCLRNHA